MELLFDESISINQRINQILNHDSNFRIEGLGKGLTTSILMDLDPEKYVTWNNKSNMGLETLGLMPKFPRGSDWGTCYLMVLEAIESIRDLKPELSFIEIDHFLHIVSATEEGQDAVKALIEGKEISSQVTQVIEQISKETESLDIIMEAYLEEFIETNFTKINFETKLELYQDEENKGRQYPTSIGRIDLLAKDEDNKNFVVIELKKGRSSDQVVGQILRYMGWVKENLAINEFENYGVKGIVISQTIDDKLKYALKLIEQIDVFLYSISFDLKKEKT